MCPNASGLSGRRHFAVFFDPPPHFTYWLSAHRFCSGLASLPQRVLAPASQHRDYEQRPCLPGFYVGAGDMSSRPHPRTGGALSSECSLPQVTLLERTVGTASHPSSTTSLWSLRKGQERMAVASPPHQCWWQRSYLERLKLKRIYQHVRPIQGVTEDLSLLTCHQEEGTWVGLKVFKVITYITFPKIYTNVNL